jgi:hypothetical protein
VRVKNYDADLRKFLSGTNYKRGLQSLNSISFAYYANDVQLTNDAGGVIRGFPERADLILVLKLLSTAPFFSVTVDTTLSSDRRSERTAGVAEEVRCFMRIIIDPLNGPRKMCKNIIMEFVEQSYTWCRGWNIGIW